MVNVDHGILPAATSDLREDLGLTDVDIGLLGSLVYLGLVIGKISYELITAHRLPIRYSGL